MVGDSPHEHLVEGTTESNSSNSWVLEKSGRQAAPLTGACAALMPEQGQNDGPHTEFLISIHLPRSAISKVCEELPTAHS